MTPVEPPLTVGVVGAGTIGRGVAHSFAEHGHRVILVDVSSEKLDAALARIRQETRAFRLIRGGSYAPPVADAVAAIEPAVGYDRLSEADLVVENVPEVPETKKEVYRRIDGVCKPSAIFAANTSAVTITSLAAATGRPDRFLGIHFMNPVPLKQTVEVIRGFHTSPETMERALGLMERIGKRGIVVEDSPGFVSNRVLMLAVNEAAYLVHERVAGAEDVDAIFTQCIGHPMGLLATADLIGLDTVLQSIERLWEQFGDGKYRPCPLLRTMVDAGLLGRKSGRGFFDYTLS